MKVRNFFRQFLKLSFCYISILAIIINSGIVLPSFAKVVLPTGRDEEFSQNNILFYNPDGSTDDCYYSGGGLIEGNSLIEKIWNYIVSANIAGVSDNPAAIAGIIGNMSTETGGTFNPFIQNGGGCTGLIQWCGMNSYNSGFRDYMKNKGLDQYYGKSVDELDPEIVDTGLQAELDFLFANGSGGVTATNFINNVNVPTNKNGESGAAAYAELFVVTVENAYETPSTAGQELNDPGVKSIASHTRYQGAASRRNNAVDIYNTYGAKSTGASSSTISTEDNTTDSSSSGTGITWSGGFIDGGTLPGYTKEVPNSGWSDETENRAFTTGEPNKILLHSTEGQTAGLAAYPSGNHYAAHFTLDAINKRVSQHYSINVASQAIKSVDTEGPIQIELVGFSQGHEDNKYSLYNWSDDEWDYVALILTAIAEETGIPLTTSVDWANPVRLSSKESFANYTGILGHMHAYANDHVDPGNIWPMLSAAFDRNPSSSKFKTGSGSVVCTKGKTGSLTSGGFSTVAEAEAAVMAEYKAINPRSYGVTDAGDEYLKSMGIADVNCASGTDLENCVAFSAWFINRFTNKSVPGLPNGSQVVSILISSYGFSDSGTTPRVYSIFSTASGSTMCGSVKCGHTGVVLGINSSTGKIIIGEAGCSSASFTGAHEYDLSKFTDGSYTFAYTDVNIGN